MAVGVVRHDHRILLGAVATWYWARDKRALPSTPLLNSLGRVLRYHMGSIALGSLVIAVVQVVRVLMWHVQRQLRATQNKVAKGFLACCQCCCLCSEKLLKFMNRNAYIEIAVYGTYVLQHGGSSILTILFPCGAPKLTIMLQLP